MKNLMLSAAAALLCVCPAFGQVGTVVVNVPAGTPAPAFSITTGGAQTYVAEPAPQVTITRYYVQPRTVQVQYVEAQAAPVTTTTYVVAQPAPTVIVEPAPVVYTAPRVVPSLVAGLAIGWTGGFVHGSHWGHSYHRGYYHSRHYVRCR